MSILAKLLKRSEEPNDAVQIPPGLRKSVAASGGRFQRRTYLLIAAGGVAAVAGGFLLILYLDNRSIPAIKPVRRPTPVQQIAVPDIQQPISSASSTVVVATKPVRNIKKHTETQKLTQKNNVKKTFANIKQSTVKTTASQSVEPIKHKTVVRDRASIDAFLFAARTAEAKRDYQQAITQYRQVLKADPDNYHVMNNVSSSLLRIGQYAEALDVANQALSINNNYPSALINAGIAHGKLGDDAAARNMLSRAVKQQPFNKSALYNLALSEEKGGLADEAISTFRKLADCGDTQGNLGMARLQEKKGNKSEALRIYHEIIELPAANEGVRETARKRISTLE